MQAKAGGAAATLTVSAGGRSVSGGALAFGHVGDWMSVPAGPAKLQLKTGAGSSKGASTDASFAPGRSYTVIALGSDGRYALQILTDGQARPGKARLRVVHAAPELGSPDIKLGGRVIAQSVTYRGASPYVTVRPGSYELEVTKPGGKQMVFGRRISLSPGTATTAVVAGSAGERAKVIDASDSTSAPAGAPKTGFGGLASGGGAPWLLALLAAMAAGTLGGVFHMTRVRRSR